MGSSWRYHHVAIMPYSIGGFYGLACTFYTGLLVLFHGLAFRLIEEPVNSLVGEKLRAPIEVNRKTNRPKRPAPPFHSIFQPRCIKLDPTYYDFSEQDWIGIKTPVLSLKAPHHNNLLH